MSLKKSDEFKREALQFALTRGLPRNQIAADFGIGMSTLNRWVTRHKDDDLMSAPHDDLHKENYQSYPMPIIDEKTARKSAADKLYGLRKNNTMHKETAQKIMGKHDNRKPGLPRTAAQKRKADNVVQGELPL